MYTDGGSYIDGTGWMDKLSFFMLPIEVGAAVANGAVDLYRTRVFVASAQDVTEEVIDAFEGPDPTTRFPSAELGEPDDHPLPDASSQL